MNPYFSKIVGEIVRTLLKALGGVLIAHGWSTDQQWDALMMDAIPLIVGFAWSAWEWYQARHKLLVAQTMQPGVTEHQVEHQVKARRKTRGLPPVTLPKNEAPY